MMRMLVLVFVLVSCVSLVAVHASDAPDGAALYKKCAKCHGADGTETKKAGGKEIKGLSAEDLETKMKGYVDGSYGGAKKKIMAKMVKKLSDEEIKALAEHIAGF